MYMRQPPRGYYPAQQVSSASLLGQVLGITAVGFLVTALATYLFRGVPFTFGLIASLGGLVLLFAINGVRANQQLSLLLFYAFTFVEGIGIAPIVSRYLAYSDGNQIVFNAATTTGLGMLVLASIVYAFSFDFRKLSGIAFGALIALLLVGLVSIFVHFLQPGVYAWLTLGVFTLLVLVDFGRIRAGGDGLSAVQIATSIYLDGINIFLALLQIFGGRSRDD